MLYKSDYKKTFLWNIKRDFSLLLTTFDYTSCAIYLKMLEDLLTGVSIFEKDPEIVNSTLFKFLKSDNIADAADEYSLQKVRDDYNKYKSNISSYKKRFLFRKILYRLTLNGSLVPKFLWKRERNTWSYFPCKEDFYLVRHVNLYNLLTGKVEIRRYDKKQANILKFKFTELFKAFNVKYADLRKDFCEHKNMFITENFWCKYLDINLENTCDSIDEKVLQSNLRGSV